MPGSRPASQRASHLNDVAWQMNYQQQQQQQSWWWCCCCYSKQEFKFDWTLLVIKFWDRFVRARVCRSLVLMHDRSIINCIICTPSRSASRSKITIVDEWCFSIIEFNKRNCSRRRRNCIKNEYNKQQLEYNKLSWIEEQWINVIVSHTYWSVQTGWMQKIARQTNLYRLEAKLHSR